MKVCSKCKQEKSLSDFNRREISPDGRQSKCRECSSIENKTLYVYRGPEKRRESQFWCNFRLTPNDVDRMFAEQTGLCAVCGEKISLTAFRGFNIDHDHKTGVVRGLLCAPCNKGLGFFRDSETILMAAVAYLKQTKTESQSPMKKLLNRILKFVGINVVKAKRNRVKKSGYRCHVPIEDAKTDAKCIPSPTCCQDEYNAGKGHVDASPTQDNKVTGTSS